jgi:hypothetical protein
MNSPRSFLSAVSLFLILFQEISIEKGVSDGVTYPITASKMGSSRMT